MRVLHVYKTSFPLTKGGVEQFFAHLTLSSDPKRVEHTILAMHAGPERQDFCEGQVRIVAIPFSFQLLSTPFSWRYIQTYQRLTKQHDVIHYHYPFPFADLLHVALKPGKPSLVTYHSDIVKQKLAKYLYGPIGRRFLSSVNRIIVSSENYRKSSEDLRPFKTKVRAIPFGLNSELLPNPDSQLIAKWKEKLGSDYFLFVGAHRYYKGLEYLLNAAEITGLPLVIAGKGEHTAQLKSDYRHLKNVNWVGLVDEESKQALLTLAKAFVLPSHLRAEAFGICLLESLQAGKPLICCDLNTGTTLINQHRETGLVVPPANSEALARAMKTLAANDDLCSQYGAAAKQRYVQNFQAKQMVDAYLEEYDQLISGQ